MKIKKILIVPSRTIVDRESQSGATAFFINGARFLKREVLGLTTTVYDGELQFYADIPEVLGSDNVYILGMYLPHFYSGKIPTDCAYPSCHGIPRGTNLSIRELNGAIGEVDAVLASTRLGKERDVVRRFARERNIPVAMIDFKDHYSIFGASATEDEICRGLRKGSDYDLYFKKDLPLGRGKDYILPIAPVPVRPESYRFSALPKDKDIFYSGKIRPKGTGDRGDIVDLVKNNFPLSAIFEHVDHSTFLSLKGYLDHLTTAKIALSPSGVVWDSFRHCEVGLAFKTALLAPKPYMEVTGPALEDGANAILYETEFRDGKYHLINAGEIIEKIKYYLGKNAERERVADKWSNDVRNGHTGTARSRYIIESMEKVF